MTCGDGTGAEGTETGCLLGGKVRMAVGMWGDGLRCLVGPVGRGCTKWPSTGLCRLVIMS